MTAPVKNNDIPQNDPYGDYGDPYGDYGSEEDPYGDYYGDDTVGMDEYGDEYVGGEEEAGSESAPLTVEYARQHLNDLLEMLKVSELSPEEQKEIKTEIAALKAKINMTVGMSPTAQEMALGQINQKMAELEAQIFGNGEEGGGSLKSQIEDTRKKAEEYLEKGLIPQSTYDKIIKDLDKAAAILEIEGESEIGTTKIQELLSAAVDNLVNGSSSSEGSQKLGDLTEMDPAEIEEIAQKHGLDLEKLPNPPTKEVIEFLMEINPELANKIAAVEEAVKARNDAIQAATDGANAQNASNTACTSDNDNTDLKHFQSLYDLKYHQDQKSQDVMNAMGEANGEIVNMLKALYPDQADIKVPDPSSASGWEALNQNYLQADKIVFGGAEIDIFNSSNGKLNVGAADSEPPVNIIGIKYDWHGNGDWEDGPGSPSCNVYGESHTARSIYDDG